MNENKGYVIVTDYVEANTGKDVSDALQKLILDNPNRTIFFPDGEYIIAKPICTPANPKNSVMLELSNQLSHIILTPCEGSEYDYSYMVLPVRLKAGT